MVKTTSSPPPPLGSTCCRCSLHKYRADPCMRLVPFVLGVLQLLMKYSKFFLFVVHDTLMIFCANSITSFDYAPVKQHPENTNPCLAHGNVCTKASLDFDSVPTQKVDHVTEPWHRMVFYELANCVGLHSALPRPQAY